MDATVQRLRRQVLSGDYSQADIYLATLLRYNLVEELEELKTKAKPVWVSYFLTLSPNNVERVKLAAALGDEVSRRLMKPVNKSSLHTYSISDSRFYVKHKNILTESEWRLLAADMSQSVLPYFEEGYPEDKRPERAITASRRFALGEITEQELDQIVSESWTSYLRATLDGAAMATVAARICSYCSGLNPLSDQYFITWRSVVFGILELGEKEDIYRQLLINHLLGIY